MLKTVVVVAGPTGIGKTKTGMALAKAYSSVIVSADSRQIYREIPIGTAAPTLEEQAEVPHFLVGTRSVFDYYNAFEFEQDALRCVQEAFVDKDVVFMVGGSMMYLDAFCNGIDELPTVDPELRKDLMARYAEEGLESLRLQLKQLDPEFYKQVDLKNAKRVIHALEICLMTGQPYSSLRTQPKKKRPFQIIRVGLHMDRALLYQRIDQRVEQMLAGGLEEEARVLWPHRDLNALNTVGYKELFAYFEGAYGLDRAVELIQRNSRRYARKQLSWFRRDGSIQWFHPSELLALLAYIEAERKKWREALA
ncbi:tRNA (adenosine(37)-N6)-dimethylallyltransferase MiaA [Geofilum rhodophaeum]|uniref:tRNA (adenosine(37)-N6)-dimethylallyltransferase MiaA n=1 Tax=Geofilum rhodophaeum TaxID=1965019 RepID=UPI000B524CFB|nr:tRNA (adenosine(37)-N6)-dimethylallyltransferase MiaA [Geofilum rhodophaeum]